MYLKYIDNNKYINKIEELYLNSFPENERFPCLRNKNYGSKILIDLKEKI